MSLDEDQDTEFLMETLQITEAKRPIKFKSHSSFCLSSPADTRKFEEEIWIRVGVPPVYPGHSIDGRSGIESRCSGRYQQLCHRKRRLEQGDGEEVSSRKARWVIVITTLVLVFMSMLLVGITLRLAPVIDDLVRKENEEIFRALTSTVTTSPNNQSATTTGKPG